MKKIEIPRLYVYIFLALFLVVLPVSLVVFNNDRTQIVFVYSGSDVSPNETHTEVKAAIAQVIASDDSEPIKIGSGGCVYNRINGEIAYTTDKHMSITPLSVSKREATKLVLNELRACGVVRGNYCFAYVSGENFSAESHAATQYTISIFGCDFFDEGVRSVLAVYNNDGLDSFVLFYN